MSHITIFEFFASYSDLSLCHEEHRCIVLRKFYIESSLRIESDIIELHWRKSMGCSLYTSKCSCYHSDSSSIKRHLWDIVSGECLVSRCRHLVLSGQIDPELDGMLDSPHTRELRCHELVVEEP